MTENNKIIVSKTPGINKNIDKEFDQERICEFLSNKITISFQIFKDQHSEFMAFRTFELIRDFESTDSATSLYITVKLYNEYISKVLS